MGKKLTSRLVKGFEDDGLPKEPLHSLHSACFYITTILRDTAHGYFFALDLASKKYEILSVYQLDEMFKKMFPMHYPFRDLGTNDIFWVEDYMVLGGFWKVRGVPGVCRSYGEALAINMDMWEQMCEYYRTADSK